MDQFTQQTTPIQTVEPYAQELPQPQVTQATGAGSPPIGLQQIEEWTRILSKYKSGKTRLDTRVKDAERWWKLHSEFPEEKVLDNQKKGFASTSAWLHNVIVSKHADALEAYPSPNILPREESDKVEAWALTHIVPVILKQNNFEETYDQNVWQKFKTGSGVYKVFWDQNKLNGLGDIGITRVDLLNLFWEPGINDIQDSKYVFHTEQRDKELLVEEYPELKDKPLSSVITPSKMPTDDNVSDEGKVVVIDVYYKKRGAVHYAKFVGGELLYATENDTTVYRKEISPASMMPVEYTRAEQGLYEHGEYPFVFDTLYPIEGSPAGYGYIDVCANPQTRIDRLNDAILKNALSNCTPRYFERVDGAINEEEFLNLDNAIIHVTGNLGEDSIRPVTGTGLSGNYINVLDGMINELRETSGNTETSTGSSTNGVTAASALAALQEAAGKGSRAATISTYRCYERIINQVIELIRQFYNMPRQFRITGNMGVQRFISFQNQFMQPQWQGMMGDQDLGYRTPIYDIEVVAEKKSSYTKIANNELALQLYKLGFFNPAMYDQALMALGMMDFDKKDELMQQVASNGMMFMQRQMLMQMSMAAAGGGAAPQGEPTAPQGDDKVELETDKGESKQVANARERANTASQPGGSKV